MIEKMEVEQTEMDSRTGNLEVCEEKNVDEAIPIDLEKKKKAQKHIKKYNEQRY